MAKTFQALTRAQFLDRVNKFAWKRQVTTVHMHHTWQPTKAQWQGEASVRAMYDFHTKTNGWSDAAQHVSLAPDGLIWTGRDWNSPPASSGSAGGWNGNSAAGPFMFETVGNFDKGKETLEGEQLATVLWVIKVVQDRFKLPDTSLKFHRNLNSPKTCPGDGIDYDEFLALLAWFKANHQNYTIA